VVGIKKKRGPVWKGGGSRVGKAAEAGRVEGNPGETITGKKEKGRPEGGGGQHGSSQRIH